jgi:hypothetical protein
VERNTPKQYTNWFYIPHWPLCSFIENNLALDTNLPLQTGLLSLHFIKYSSYLKMSQTKKVIDLNEIHTVCHVTIFV